MHARQTRLSQISLGKGSTTVNTEIIKYVRDYVRLKKQHEGGLGFRDARGIL